ncbi:16S rRNA (guanine(966)-N(2))-methyltransferase RsmD [Pseudidiomarina terrestris]|uniref:16S rRNA (guanine(966)-N(2))-methyltransferase RsmD n=1 Tax=Pseudidiomarina terrestris TaxID=2820060 RepID=UPI0026555C04|nr:MULTISPECIES: 16S rRNA (guanine(966)-N(2))-methyltransferase RsmD [unclassified Pseudidiomarina]MDN7134181.1 16S rRNA (guanine(966)-N(2))-methyltransferase RsmD [Pseudidiomarina sp. 1ASP75-5]MDN7137132.1 16S rRNA (guanine(966)-N(2))-methyltransferase RsmD [Pseudidiomarina sp. 1ASP75-14]
MGRTSNKQKSGSRGAAGQLRIIGGRLRGRKLAVADLPGLRPTTDRVRETLFNWLQFELPQRRCLDLFAGTGALGLEALSRGASEVTLIERNATAAALLTEHTRALNDQCHGSATVAQADALQWLTQAQMPPFDIVFVDPPFHSDLAAPACALLQQQQLIHSGSLIYLETEKEWPLKVPANWRLEREKLAGQVCYRLFTVAAEEDLT